MVDQDIHRCRRADSPILGASRCHCGLAGVEEEQERPGHTRREKSQRVSTQQTLEVIWLHSFTEQPRSKSQSSGLASPESPTKTSRC